MVSPVSARPFFSRANLLRKHVVLPQQHGSWAIWLGPFAVGIGGGNDLRPGLLWLTLAALGGFLALQPLTVLVKVLAGRRPRTDLYPAIFWLAAYLLLSTAGALGLLFTGNGGLLLLGLAALPVLAWQMILVARREERGQMSVELVGAGVLSLAAPAAFWVSGGANATGWWLWAMCWLQAAGAIVYIYLRLEQRRMTALPAWPERLRLARRSTLYNSTNLILVAAISFLRFIPPLSILPFAAMLLEALYGGLLRPAIGAKPAALGVRQIVVTAVFSVLVILAYRM